jgi:hypothetical protein
MLLNKDNRALSLVEIIIISAIASFVLVSIFMIWTRTGRTASRGGEMLDLQIAVRSINDRIRSDVRTLSEVVSATENSVSFLAYHKGRKVEVKYRYDPAGRSLLRETAGSPGIFRADGLVTSARFSCKPSREKFEYLQLAVELTSEGQGNAVVSKLAQVMVFSSRSLDPAFVDVK